MKQPEPSEWLPEWDDPGYVYEPTMPSYRNDVAGYWATCFDDFEAATRYWAMLMASFGMEPDDAAEYGMRRARDDGYIPDGYRRQPIERNDIATIKAQLRIEDEAEKLTRMPAKSAVPAMKPRIGGRRMRAVPPAPGHHRM